MSIEQAISNAQAMLPGNPIDSGEDPRWQAIAQIADYVESDPEDIWRFVARWGRHEQEDLRSAIACLLLEHLLEYHFDRIFPRVEQAAAQHQLFADMFCRCWKFGQAEAPDNAHRFDQLQKWCRNAAVA